MCHPSSGTVSVCRRNGCPSWHSQHRCKPTFLRSWRRCAVPRRCVKTPHLPAGPRRSTPQRETLQNSGCGGIFTHARTGAVARSLARLTAPARRRGETANSERAACRQGELRTALRNGGDPLFCRRQARRWVLQRGRAQGWRGMGCRFGGKVDVDGWIWMDGGWVDGGCGCRRWTVVRREVVLGPWARKRRDASDLVRGALRICGAVARACRFLRTDGRRFARAVADVSSNCFTARARARR
ncbi:hypothetical protein EDC01DRAFT_461500 [Geopyxis carbonaria]|nr:hypothetical protein EDC01DRAFT_461500 [Geopyxis carbonaria]